METKKKIVKQFNGKSYKFLKGFDENIITEHINKCNNLKYKLVNFMYIVIFNKDVHLIKHIASNWVSIWVYPDNLKINLENFANTIIKKLKVVSHPWTAKAGIKRGLLKTKKLNFFSLIMYNN